MGLLDAKLVFDEGVLTKNTFIDHFELTDESIPSSQMDVHCRTRNEPLHSHCCSQKSTEGSVSPRSSDSEVHAEPSIPSSPTSSRGTPPTASPLATSMAGPDEIPELGSDGFDLDACEDYPLPAGPDWNIRIRRTFLEFHWPDSPKIRRSSSCPEIKLNVPDGVCTTVSAASTSMPYRDDDPDYAGGTRTPDDLERNSQLNGWWPGTPDTAEWPLYFFPTDVASDPFAVDMQWGSLYPEVSQPPSWTAVAGQCDFSVLQAGLNRRRKKRGPNVFMEALPMTGSARDKNQRPVAPLPDDQRSYGIITESRNSAMDNRPGKVWELSCRDRESSLAVQQGFQILHLTMTQSWNNQDWETYEWAVFDVQSMTRDLQGHVIDALKHHHANHVIKQLVDIMPTELIGFIPEELKGWAPWAAKHSYGCRTMLRLVRHCGQACWASECAESVVAELLQESEDLCSDEFGKFVLEEFLESGLPEHKRRVVQALKARLQKNVKNKHASTLIGKALRHCDSEDGMELVTELFKCRETVQSLIRNQFSLYVLKDIAMLGSYTQKVKTALLSLSDELHGMKQGRKLMELLSDLE